MKLTRILFILLLSFTVFTVVGNAALDRKLKVSSNDATAAYLSDKLDAGSNVTLSEQNDGADESIQVSVVIPASGLILDLLDDDSDESSALAEIAVTNDVNSIITEPSADKMLINMANDWPKSDDADDVTCVGCVADAELATDFIAELELDTETELETQLTDVTNVFTNNDGALNDDDLTNNSITDLSDVTAISGNSTVVATTSGATTSGDFTKFDVNGNVVASGIQTIASPVTDNGSYIEPNTDGDGYEVWDSGGLKSLQISHNGTEAVFNVSGTSPLYRFPDLANCDTIDADANGVLSCGTDATTGLGVAEAIDLGDTGSPSSLDMDEFATTNDTNGVFTNPIGGKLLVNLSNDWPKADDADNVTCTGCVSDGELATDFISEIELDTEAELEAQLTDVTNVIVSTEIDTEAELEALLSDVTNVLTNNDGVVESTTGGRSLTLSTYAVDADAELYTDMFNATLISPVDTDDAMIQIKAHGAFTITRVSCSTDVGTVTIQLDERVESTPNTAGTDVMTSQLVCDSNMEATTSFTNAGIAADAIISMDIDATATSPTILRLHIEGTWDD